MTHAHPDDDRLIAYVLHELEERERPPFEDHVARCAACSTQVQRLSRVLEGECSATERRAPARILVELLCRQAQLQERRHAFLRRFRQPALALVSLGLLALFFGAGYLHGRHTVSVTLSQGRDARHTIETRAPLPAPPPMTFETATASGGDLALVQWGAPMWRQSAAGSATPVDSL